MRKKKRHERTGAIGAAILFSTLFVSVAAVWLVPALDRSACSPRDRVVAGLDRLFGEVHRGRAVTGDDSVMEFFSSRTNGTWTLLRTLPDGRSCVVATGSSTTQQASSSVFGTALDI